MTKLKKIIIGLVLVSLGLFITSNTYAHSDEYGIDYDSMWGMHNIMHELMWGDSDDFTEEELKNLPQRRYRRGGFGGFGCHGW